MKIAEGLEMLALTANLSFGAGVIHPSLIFDHDSVVLVDTGLPGLLPQFGEAMAKAGVPFEKLNKIIITHHDMDHIGSLSAILMAASQKESSQKIEVLAHEKEEPYIQAELPPVRLTQIEAQLGSLSGERGQQMKALYESLKVSYPNFKAIVDRTVADGEELPYCGGITVVYTPGHTPGHICLYMKRNKTLIAGDAMNVVDGMLVPAPPFTTTDQEAAVKSLQKLTGFDIETVICYHGGLYTDNPNRRIAEIAKA